MNFNDSRGDFNWNRLFFHLTQKLNAEIEHIHFIKPNIIMVMTNKGTKVLKGYTSQDKIVIQHRFISLLHANGFLDTPKMEILKNENTKVMYLNNLYWGMFPFVENKEKFTFASKDDRKSGLKLLTKFHDVTEPLVSIFHEQIPSYHMHQKWIERQNIFFHHMKLFQYYFGHRHFHYIYSLFTSSLSFMPLFFEARENRNNVIIHGDVAHHNFMKTNKNIFLLDFDLISVAPESVDILQYANRLLPYINWSYKELSSIEGLSSYLKKKWFLACLAYPQDIYREWLRILTKSQANDMLWKEKVIAEISENIEMRKPFVEQIFSMIK